MKREINLSITMISPWPLSIQFNKILNQKKFYDLNLNSIYLQTKKNISKINLNDEFLFINKDKKIEFLNEKMDLEFFKSFKGCVFLCDFLCLKNEKESYNKMIFFYNSLTSDIRCYNLSSKFESLVIQNIIKLYLEDDKNFIELKDIYYLLLNDFVERINKEKKIFIFKEERGFPITNYSNKKSLLLYLKKN